MDEQEKYKLEELEKIKQAAKSLREALKDKLVPFEFAAFGFYYGVYYSLIKKLELNANIEEKGMLDVQKILGMRA